MARGQVWLASVPFQENPSSSKSRPVIVLGEFPDGDVFAAKVTSQDMFWSSVVLTGNRTAIHLVRIHTR